ncbi:co-chaperone HscB [Vibrio algivorus]|uniref:Co-chaperone protein HscB homolog n=1 Tax=Vibrio algivorus TaxID=1667024 RepID=A0A557P6G0_9VIBR|nr:co-chaperone HscB [Vibrio algivorus]TVO36246.1 co-chaperone HscB [Vibrio algivorus]GLT15465.1 co-chaperone protein HscB [Vibrio algivorus]
MNHFELFGLPNQFELDNNTLSETFRDLQRRFHPDKFASASERDRLMAVQKAAEINDAYQTLKSPISRAEYILALQGIDIRAEQQTMSDPMFLMEQMELREEIEIIAQSNEPESALFDFDSKIQTMYQQQLAQLKKQLESEQWDSAADGVRKLKFVNKLRYEIEQLEDKLLG